MSSAAAPPKLRQQILDDLVRDEVTGGARVEHRDSVTVVLAKGRDRLLVVVDDAGAVHVDRLEQPRGRRGLLVIAAAVIGAVVVVVLLLQLGIASAPG